MTEVVAFPRKTQRTPQANQATDAIDLMRREADYRRASHVFAALVHEDGTVSRWSFSSSGIKEAATLKSVLLAIELLRHEAFTVVEEP